MRFCLFVESRSCDWLAGNRIAKPLVASSKYDPEDFLDLLLLNDEEEDFLNLICWFSWVDKLRALLLRFALSSVLSLVGVSDEGLAGSMDGGNEPQ